MIMKLILLVLIIKHTLSLPIQEDALGEKNYDASSPSNNLTMCEKDSLCNYGQCIQLNTNQVTCKCEKPYVDHDNQFCAAKGKSKLTLFLLSFFAGGFGADWFYMSSGDSIFICVGIIKIFMFSIFPLIIFFLGLLVALFIDKHFGETLVMAGIIIFLLAGLIWWFVDWIRIVSDGWIVDGKGIWIYVDM